VAGATGVNEALVEGLEVVVDGFGGVTDAAELAATELCGETGVCEAVLEVFTDKACCGCARLADPTWDLGFEPGLDTNAVTIIAATKTPALARLARSTLKRAFLEDFGSVGSVFGNAATGSAATGLARTVRV